jgi:hypothetical protein
MGNAIDRALAAWSGGDRVAALELLLDRWRASAAPPLGDAIGRLTDVVARPRGAIPGRTRADLVRSWREVEATGDRFDVPRLLEALRRLLTHDAHDLLHLADEWPRDPRVSEGLVRLCARPPHSWLGWDGAWFWRGALDLIGATRDPRARSGLEAALHAARGTYLAELRFGSELARRAPALIEALPAAAPDLDPDERSSLRALLATGEVGAATPHESLDAHRTPTPPPS